MQLQKVCKKGARIFQRIRPKVEGSSNPSGSLNDGERNDNNDSRHITSVLLWQMVGYTPSSFADLVIASERIKVGLRRGKFNHLAWTNEKTGANEEGENEGETHAAIVIPIRPSFPPTQQCHYSANNNPSHYPPPSHPQRPSLKSTTRPVYRTSNDEDHL